MSINSEMVLKFKKSLPETVRSSVIQKILHTCSEQEYQPNWLSDDIQISYGKAKHILIEFKGEHFININFSNDGLPMSWIFDNKGELIAT